MNFVRQARGRQFNPAVANWRSRLLLETFSEAETAFQMCTARTGLDPN